MISQEQAAAIKVLCEKHHEHRLAKYRDWRACCQIAQYYIQRAGIGHAPPVLKILDLGAGLSYLGAECQELGHEATSLDLPEALPEEAARVLGVRYIPCVIMANMPLPVDGMYDVITAIRLNMTEPDRWGWDEYRVFADEVLSHLNLGGRWLMAPNRGANVAFVLDADKWREILNGRATVTNPTKDTILITKQ